MRLVLALPLHALGRVLHRNPRTLDGTGDIGFAFLQEFLLHPGFQLPVGLEVDSPFFNVLLDIVKVSLDADEKIKIAIDAGGSGKIIPLDVGGRVSHARALRPKLVALGAGQGTCSTGACRTAVLGHVDIAFNRNRKFYG